MKKVTINGTVYELPYDIYLYQGLCSMVDIEPENKPVISFSGANKNNPTGTDGTLKINETVHIADGMTITIQ